MLGIMCSMNIWAQTRTITGKVTDEGGQPISGVVVNGGNVKVPTAGDGTYSITVSTGLKKLVFLSSNHESFSAPIGTNDVIDAKLKEVQLIVTGYQRVKRNEYAGAATTVTADKIKSTPIASFDQILQGRAPGVSVLSGSGQPGSSASVVIRGSTSILGGSSPLYILDGVPVEAGVFQSINPNNFETIDILRDAISTAQYGSRGSAGVIVATTKRGSTGKAKISFLYQTGRKFKPQFNYTMMNSAELMRAQQEVGVLSGTSAGPGWTLSSLNPSFAAQSMAVQAQRLKSRDSLSNIDNDWDNNFFRTGKFDSYDLTISGGQGKLRYLTALGTYQEQAIIRRSDLKRYTLQNNIDYNDDKLTLLVTNTIGYTKRNFQQSAAAASVFNPFLSSRITAPYYTPKNATGAVNFNGTGLAAYGPYLIDAMEKDQSYNDQIKTSLGVNAVYKVHPDIGVGAFGAVDFRETQGTVHANPLTITNTPLINSNVRTQGGSLTENLSRFVRLNGRLSLNYNKTIANKHKISGIMFYEILQEFFKFQSQQGFNLDPRRPNTFAAVGPVNTGNAVNYYPNTSGIRDLNATNSVAMFGNYTYNDKYTFNLVLRRDGSSKLSEENRFQNFYSAGATWNLTNESFLSNKRNINSLRLKVNYGITGNSDNFPNPNNLLFGDNFIYLETYNSGLYIGGPTGNNSTIFVSNPGSPKAKWEITNLLNLGVDFAFFNNRITGDVQVYNKWTDNAFVNLALPFESGFAGTSVVVNEAGLSNKGIEAQINFDVIRKPEIDFTWTIGGNFAYNKNKVTSLGNINNFERGTERITVGLPLGSHFVNGWSGVDAATGKPLYLDVNGNVTDAFSASDRTQNWGTSEAPYKGGFTTSVRYKNFEVSTLFSWQRGSKRLNNLEFFVENPGFLQNGFNQSASLNYWKKPGDVARVQGAAYQNQFSSKYIQNADFLRLRNLSISYTMPKSIVSKLKMSNVRAFIVGQNLAVWTTWKGYDPEDDNNISLSEFPNPRALTAGVEITF